jgi:hypothetical protein
MRRRKRRSSKSSWTKTRQESTASKLSLSTLVRSLFARFRSQKSHLILFAEKCGNDVEVEGMFKANAFEIFSVAHEAFNNYEQLVRKGFISSIFTPLYAWLID